MNEEGAGRRRRAQGPKTQAIQQAVAELDPQVAEWVDSFVFGEVWSRDGMDEEDRTLVAITALAATRQTEQLRTYLFGALHRGIPARRIHEALVMLAVYAGFPVALQSLQLWSEVVESARRQGIDVPSLTDPPEHGITE
jgi:4-carboxymuconolactone decarboxylase